MIAFYERLIVVHWKHSPLWNFDEGFDWKGFKKSYKVLVLVKEFIMSGRKTPRNQVQFLRKRNERVIWIILYIARWKEALDGIR